MKYLLKWIAWVLVVIGGLNWGFYAFGYNLVGILPGALATIVYVLVGISAIVLIVYKAKKLMKKKKK
jgi:hypothetical protein